MSSEPFGRQLGRECDLHPGCQAFSAWSGFVNDGIPRSPNLPGVVSVDEPPGEESSDHEQEESGMRG